MGIHALVWIGLFLVGVAVVLLAQATQHQRHARLLALDEHEAEGDALVRIQAEPPLTMAFSDGWTLECGAVLDGASRTAALPAMAELESTLREVLSASVARVSWSPLADGPAPERDLSNFLLQQLVEPLLQRGVEPHRLQLHDVRLEAAEVALPAPEGATDQWVIGREGDLEVQGPGVSRRHVLVRRAAGQWMVMDLGSANGTWVRGQRLQPNVPVVVHLGEVLTLGRETPVDLRQLLS